MAFDPGAQAGRVARGRVLDVRAPRLTVQVDTRVETLSVDVHCGDAASCRPGDLVEVERDTGVVRRVFAHPTGEFPEPGSDALRLMRDGGAGWVRLAQRARLLQRTREWFAGAGFLEVDTPLVVPSAGTETHLAAVPALLTEAPGAPPTQRYLVTSPEYHMKRLLAAGAPPIYQIGKVFRDGERGHLHRPEFTMLEWYRPWAGYEAIMADCEAWLRHLAGGDTLTFRGRTIDLTPPWPRISFKQALRERGGVADPDALSPEDQLAVHVDKVEPTLGQTRPELLTEWPIAMASLARPAPHDPSVAERFELFVAGLELGNAFGELTDAAEQRRRCEADNAERRALGRPEYPIDEDFLGALEQGLPPSAGIAVGLDRVLMLLTDAARIDDVLSF